MNVNQYKDISNYYNYKYLQMSITINKIGMPPDKYDQWKQSKLSEIDTDFISDEMYFHQKRNLFHKVKKDVLTRLDKSYFVYNDEPNDLLEPFLLEDVELFEKTNKIYLPIYLKYYLTHITQSIYYHVDWMHNTDEDGALYYFNRSVVPIFDDKNEIITNNLLSELPNETILQKIPYYDQLLYFVCDGCDIGNIKDIRYHCNVCLDYDLCIDCYKNKNLSETHKKSHSMTKYNIFPILWAKTIACLCDDNVSYLSKYEDTPAEDVPAVDISPDHWQINHKELENGELVYFNWCYNMEHFIRKECVEISKHSLPNCCVTNIKELYFTDKEFDNMNTSNLMTNSKKQRLGYYINAIHEDYIQDIINSDEKIFPGLIQIGHKPNYPDYIYLIVSGKYAGKILYCNTHTSQIYLQNFSYFN